MRLVFSATLQILHFISYAPRLHFQQFQ